MHKIIAGIEFHTIASITDHARKIKERYVNEARISGDDELFMRDFIELHPRAEEKKGVGFRISRSKKRALEEFAPVCACQNR